MSTYSPLLTDQYQFIMSYGYWQLKKSEQQAVFQLYFRTHPFRNHFTVCCGLASVIDYLQNWRFREDDIHYLSSLTANNKALFAPEFLDYLAALKFTGDIDAIPEGTVVFPNQPLIRITAPLLQCQLLETPLINLMHFSSLIATKAARICIAAQGDPVVDFGLRRAQGPDGGVTASRAAYIGGCVGTSNVLAGKLFDIPIKGTQAHSWIMAFNNELEAFSAFAKTSATDVSLLVDTYDTLQGVLNAIEIGQRLREQKRHLSAIRLDSGNLAELSKQARAMLDDAGFHHTKIMVSSDLDEYRIAELKQQGACIDLWGVGTRLVTAFDQPALNIIYKLAAIQENGEWQYKRKISNDVGKSTIPGIHQVKRYFHKGEVIKDTLYDTHLSMELAPPKEADASTDLLVPVFKQGELVYELPKLAKVQQFCQQQLRQFSRFKDMPYPVELDSSLVKLNETLRSFDQ